MSADRPRKPGQPVYRKPKLRLVESPDPRPVPSIDHEVKALLDDMKRHRRERVERGSNDGDAA